MADWLGRALLGSLLSIFLLTTGCQPTAKMQPGVPLEVRRGYCLLNTEFKQHGKPVNPDNVMQRLTRHRASAAYVSDGNALAIGSILATLAAGSAIVVGSLAKQDKIDMSDGASTGLIAGGVGVGALSWVLCITSDGKYVAAANVYNAGLPKTDPSDERAYEAEETWK